MKIFCARPKPDKQLKNICRWIAHVLEKEGYLAEQFKQNQPCTSPSFFWYKKDFLGHPSILSSIFFCKVVTNLSPSKMPEQFILFLTLSPASFYWKLISATYIPPRYLTRCWLQTRVRNSPNQAQGNNTLTHQGKPQHKPNQYENRF